MKFKFFTIAVLLFSFALSASAQTEKMQLLAKSKQAVAALKNKNMRALAALVHPTKGLRFSPYGYIDAEKDLTFKKSQVPQLFSMRRSFVWGQADGTGDDIKMTFAEYYKRYVFDRDFSRGAKITYNKAIGKGNTTVNIAEVYPNAKFVEYNLPGTTKYDGMDWRSLRLIFEKSGRNWYLVGVSHDEWTI